ncbi:MAG: teichoic acid D-Ala incorporation-associated protein DltX [Lachnospiraceae bacterium]|jgi:hypothetical protein|nr:teichoic acid D-Ala incorporation-associated protein DltX [Lachnospiraceae bacterium]
MDYFEVEFAKGGKMKNKKDILIFIGKTLFFTVVILGLLYLYHYTSSTGGGFIYNEF